MKNKRFHFFVFALMIMSFQACAQLFDNPADKEKYLISEIVHPGIMNTADDLNSMKIHVNNGDEPWLSAYKVLLAWKGSSLNWKPTPFADVHRDGYGTNRVGDPAITEDAEAAYSHALQWVITGDEAHAKKAIEILNAWSSTLKSITGEDDNLLAGMAAQKYCNAAEIILHTYNNWAQNDVDQFKNMLLTVYYPLISDFYTNSPTSNGNWGLSMLNSVLAIAVFCDDVEMFNGAVYHVIGTKSKPYSTLSGYIDAKTGQCQESGRDQGHTQMGLGYLVAACEICWNQGSDIYSYLDNRLLLGMEYTAKYNLGYDVEYHKMYGKFEDVIAEKGRGNFAPIYERVYDHYVRVKGLSMPYTKMVIDKIRPEGFSSSMTSWGTLTGYRGDIIDSGVGN